MYLRDSAKLEFEKRQERTKRFFREWEDYRRASKHADPEKPLRREADSTEAQRLQKAQKYMINRDKVVFKRPNTPPTPTIRIKPRPITVGTQTWPSTIIKRIKPSAPTKSCTIPIATAFFTAAPTKPSSAKKCIGSIPADIYKRKRPNIEALNVTSKSGRYDHATVMRSVINDRYVPPSQSSKDDPPAKD